MQPDQLTKLAAALHFGLALAGILYTTRWNNHADLSAISAKELAAMTAIALLPLVAAWIGLKLAGTQKSRWLLAIGQTLALLAFAATFVAVAGSTEPMAPLLFLLVSIWIAGGLAVVLIAVGLAGRR
jgi:hypothetical protein